MGEIKEFQPMECHVFKDYGAVFDEKGSTYGTIRKVQWIKAKEEIDEAKAKLEIRKLFTTKEGERLGKGYTFSTEDGPHELTQALVDNGFGHTKPILKSLRNREDFADAVNTINDDDEGGDEGEMFDMRDLLLGESIDG